MATPEFLERLRKTLVADGRLLEAGFVQFRLDHGLEGAAAEQLIVLRRAFLSGAQQVYAITVTTAYEPELRPGDDVIRALKLREEVGGFLIEEVRRREGEAAQETAP